MSDREAVKNKRIYRAYQFVSVLGLVFGGILLLMRETFAELAVNTFIGNEWFFVVIATLMMLGGLSGIVAFSIKQPMLKYFGYSAKEEIIFRRSQIGRLMTVLVLFLVGIVFLYLILPFEWFGLDARIIAIDDAVLIGLNIGLVLVIFQIIGKGIKRLLFEGITCPYCSKMCENDIVLLQHIEFESRFGKGHNNVEWVAKEEKPKKKRGRPKKEEKKEELEEESEISGDLFGG